MNNQSYERFAILDSIRQCNGELLNEQRWQNELERTGEIEGAQAHARMVEIIQRKIERLETFLENSHEQKAQCPHTRVEIHTRLYAMQTRYEPAEYEHKVQCLECGKWLDLADVPEEAKRREA